jgi:anti-sigma factor RsiW
MTSERPVTDDELHAMADGRLAPERQAEVEAYLADQPAAAARVGFYGRLNAGLHELYDPLLHEPVPHRLTVRPPTRNWLAVARAAAAAIVLLAVGGTSGWLWRDHIANEYEQPAHALADLAAYAHVVYAAEIQHPTEVPGSEKDQLQTWLSNRLRHPVQVPQLTAVGYTFMGGRLLPSDHDVAAQLMYQNVNGNRVSLYFKPARDQRDAAFQYVVDDGVSVFYWHDSNFAYGLASELPREQLLKICNEVYQQLNPGAGPVSW